MVSRLGGLQISPAPCWRGAALRRSQRCGQSRGRLGRYKNAVVVADDSVAATRAAAKPPRVQLASEVVDLPPLKQHQQLLLVVV